MTQRKGNLLFVKGIKAIIGEEGDKPDNRNENIRGKKQNGVWAVATNSMLLLKYKAQNRKN